MKFAPDEYPHGELTERIIGAAIKVHRALGPGLLESAYEVCLADEMERGGLHFTRQVPLPVIYQGRRLDCGYRLDFVVEDRVVVELKCVDKVIGIHEAQLLTYLRLAHKDVGLILNFNVEILRNGITRKALTNLNAIEPVDCVSTSLAPAAISRVPSLSSVSSAPQR